MQEEIHNLGADAAQEPNNAPNLWGSMPPPATTEQASGEVVDAPAADLWGGEVADAPAADPWGSAPHPGTVEREEGPPLVEEPGPDEPSATERVEPLGSEAAPIEGYASPLIGGGASMLLLSSNLWD